MWIAKNKTDEYATLFFYKPTRMSSYWCCPEFADDALYCMGVTFPNEKYKELRWEDNPVEVTVNVV